MSKSHSLLNREGYEYEISNCICCFRTQLENERRTRSEHFSLWNENGNEKNEQPMNISIMYAMLGLYRIQYKRSHCNR